MDFIKRAVQFLFFLLIITDVLGLDLQKEILEWSGYGLLGAGAIGFVYTEPFFEEPWLEGPTDFPKKSETVPSEWLYGGGFSAAAMILLVPNSENVEIDIKYNHIKGFARAVAFERFTTGLLKDAVGRYRPNSDARQSAGMNIRHIRDSFPSGHAGFSFTTATYLSLYTWQYIGNDKNSRSIVAKSAVGTAMFGAATAVSLSRIEDNVHHPGDVAAGALIGIFLGASSYIYQEKCLEREAEFSISPTYQGINLTWRF